METSLEKNVSNNVKSSTHCQHAIDNGSNNVSRNGDILECALEEHSTCTLSDDGSLSPILGLQMKKFIQTRSHSQVYGKVDRKPSSHSLISETHGKRKYTTVSEGESKNCILYKNSTDLDSSFSKDSDGTSASKMDSLLIDKGLNCNSRIKSYQYVKDPKSSSLSHSNKVIQTNETFQKQKACNRGLINNEDDKLSLNARHSSSNRPNDNYHEDSTTRSTYGENKTHVDMVNHNVKMSMSNEAYDGIISKDQCILVEKESFFLMILLIDSVEIVEKSLENVPFHFHLSWIADSKSVSSPTYFFDGSVSVSRGNGHTSKKSSLTSRLTSLDWCTYLETQLDSSSMQQTISPLYLHKTAAKEALFRGKIVLNLTHEKSNETLALAAFNVNDLGASDVFRKLNVELLTTAGVFAVITLYVACQKRWVKVHPSRLECEPRSFQKHDSPFYNVDQDDQAHFLHQFVTQEVIQSRDFNESESRQSDHTDIIETDSIANATIKMHASKDSVEREVQPSPTSSRLPETHDTDRIPSHSSNDSYFKENLHEEPPSTQSVSAQDDSNIREEETNSMESQDASVEISNEIKQSNVLNENFYEKQSSLCKTSWNKEETHTKTTKIEKKDENEGVYGEELLEQNTEWSHCKPIFEMSTEKSKTGLRELFHVCQQLTEIPDNTTSALEEERNVSSDNSPHVLLRKAIHLCIGLCQQVTQSSNKKEATEAKEYLVTLRSLANRIGRSLEESVVCETSHCYSGSNKSEKLRSSNRIRSTKGFPINSVLNINKTRYISHSNENEGHTDVSLYEDSQQPKDMLNDTHVNGNSETLSALHGRKSFDKNYLCLGYSSNAMVWKRSLLNHKDEVSSSHGVECSISHSLPKMVDKPQKYKRLFPESRTIASTEESSVNDLQSNWSSHPMSSSHVLDKAQSTRLENSLNFFEKRNPMEYYSNSSKKKENGCQNQINSLHEAASLRKESIGFEKNGKKSYTIKKKSVDVEQDLVRDAEVYGLVLPQGEEKQWSKDDANANSKMEWHALANNLHEKNRILKREAPSFNEDIPKASNYTHEDKMITPPTFLTKRHALSRLSGLEKHSSNDLVRSRSMERIDSPKSAVDTRLYPCRSDQPEISHNGINTHLLSNKFTFKNNENFGSLEPSSDEYKKMIYGKCGNKKNAENKILLRDVPQESVVFKGQSTLTESPHFILNKEDDQINISGPYRQPVNAYDKMGESLENRDDVWESKQNTTSNSSMDGEAADGIAQVKMPENKDNAKQRLSSTHASRVEQLKKKSVHNPERYQLMASDPSVDHNLFSHQKNVEKNTGSNTFHRDKDLFGGTRVGVIKERLNHARRLEKTQSANEFIQPATVLHDGKLVRSLKSSQTCCLSGIENVGSNVEHEARRQQHYGQKEYKCKKSFVKEEYMRQAEYRSDSPEDHSFTYEFHRTHGTEPNRRHETHCVDTNHEQNITVSLNDIPSSACPSSECIGKSPHQNESNSCKHFGDSSASEREMSHIHTTRKNSLAHRSSCDVPAGQQLRSKCYNAVPCLALHRENEGHVVDVQVGFVTPPLPAKPLPTRRHHGSFMCSTFPLQCGNTRPPLLGGALANNSTN